MCRIVEKGRSCSLLMLTNDVVEQLRLMQGRVVGEPQRLSCAFDPEAAVHGVVINISSLHVGGAKPETTGVLSVCSGRQQRHGMSSGKNQRCFVSQIDSLTLLSWCKVHCLGIIMGKVGIAGWRVCAYVTRRPFCHTSIIRAVALCASHASFTRVFGLFLREPLATRWTPGGHDLSTPHLLYGITSLLRSCCFRMIYSSRPDTDTFA